MMNFFISEKFKDYDDIKGKREKKNTNIKEKMLKMKQIL